MKEYGASHVDRRTCLKTIGALGIGASASSTAVTGETSPSSVDVTRVSIDSNWAPISLDTSYADPVVFGLPPSFQGHHPCSTRIRSVTSTAFEIAIEEWLYCDGWHKPESVGCFVSESGVFTLADGTILEVGRTRTDHRWTGLEFSGSFSSTPVILSQTQTRNDSDPVVTRHREASSSGVEIRLQEAEDQGTHDVEDIGYLAIDAGGGEINGHAFEAGIADHIGSSWTTLSFTNSYTEPVFLADLQTFRGHNTATLRYRNLTDSNVEIMVEEEESADSERWHKEEQVGYLVFEGGGSETGYGFGGYGSDGYGH